MEAEIAEKLEKLLAELPETISLEDVQRHDWLRRLVIATDDLANRVEYRAIEWAKTSA